MAVIKTKRTVPLEALKPYENNARTHSEEQIGQIADSITEFGFLNPILIDTENNIIAGHGRYMAAQRLGMTSVPCLQIEGLSDEQRRAYILADNRLTELGGWDMDLVKMELDDLKLDDFDIDLIGFDINTDNWYETRERWDNSRQEGNEEYNEFLDKFENPKTTDDCYTPDNIYDVVAEYAERLSGIKREKFVRPFYPNGDYQNEKYPEGCVVVDNPPFSILAEIVNFYAERKQPFFLFAPGLSALGYTNKEGVAAICTYAPVTYENKAKAPTSFVTNLEPEDVVAIADPDLYAEIERVNEENEAAMHNSLPKYEYPLNVATAAKLGYLSKYGQELIIKRKDAAFIRALDAQKEQDKGIFGSALLLSEKAAAEKAAATRWPLSERELEIVKSLGGDR